MELVFLEFQMKMEKDRFEKIQNISKKIERFESYLRQIDLLLKCCGLNCKINGTPPNAFTQTECYEIRNRDLIKGALVSEREEIFNELNQLYKIFAEM